MLEKITRSMLEVSIFVLYGGHIFELFTGKVLPKELYYTCALQLPMYMIFYFLGKDKDDYPA